MVARTGPVRGASPAEIAARVARAQEKLKDSTLTNRQRTMAEVETMVAHLPTPEERKIARREARTIVARRQRDQGLLYYPRTLANGPRKPTPEQAAKSAASQARIARSKTILAHPLYRRARNDLLRLKLSVSLAAIERRIQELTTSAPP